LNYLHKETEELWGQQTIRFYDPENNLVEIGETIPCFVKRFKSQGMSIEEVSKRTSVPIEIVEQNGFAKYLNRKKLFVGYQFGMNFFNIVFYFTDKHSR
jgi:hypothetical protein